MDFRNMDVLREESGEGAEMGFTGKQVIHPAQVDVVQECFAPSRDTMRRAWRIVEGYQKHYKLGKGAFDLDGKAIDMPVVKWAYRVLQRAELAGIDVDQAAYSTETPLATFANQGKLPRLPIPTLEETVARYLKSLRPLLPAPEYVHAERMAGTFIKSNELGPILQRRLQEVDAQAPHSWLEDIWLKKAYLEWRDPSYINVNWFALLADNPDFPIVADAPRGRPTKVQIERAARLITHMLEANEALNQEKIPADMQRDAPLCMN
ncbi:hypothetical protein GGH95_006037, partial [Coemansia sp. RSA 1836]